VLGAALLGFLGKTRLPSEHLQDDTNGVIGLVANLFVVMTALVLGLMLNSAKNTFETNSHDIRMLATELILLDRTMRVLGPEAEHARDDRADPAPGPWPRRWPVPEDPPRPSHADVILG
jgi:hypothetical protein